MKMLWQMKLIFSFSFSIHEHLCFYRTWQPIINPRSDNLMSVLVLGEMKYR